MVPEVSGRFQTQQILATSKMSIVQERVPTLITMSGLTQLGGMVTLLCLPTIG